MEFPGTAEILVILFICVWTFAIGNLSTLGDWVWKLRCRLSPSLTDGSNADDPEADSTGPDP